MSIVILPSNGTIRRDGVFIEIVTSMIKTVFVLERWQDSNLRLYVLPAELHRFELYVSFNAHRLITGPFATSGHSHLAPAINRHKRRGYSYRGAVPFQSAICFLGLAGCFFRGYRSSPTTARLAHHRAGIGGIVTMSRNSPLVVGNAGVEPAIAVFPLLQPHSEPGLSCPSVLPAPGLRGVVWFDFGEGYLPMASINVPMAAICLRIRALALASFWHNSQ